MPYSTSANRNPAMSSFEKSVKGGTKVKLAPPKAKYVEHILQATQAGDAGVAEVFRTLTNRLRDSTWTVAFKALIIVHLMIKEGAQDITLRYLAASPEKMLAINNYTDVQTQGQNIKVYSKYLLARAQAYKRGKCDYVRSGEGRMKRLSVDKGLLRETELVQAQIRALVECDLLTHDDSNEISLTAFRLLTRDLLDLFNVENEAVMNVLSHYFEMSKPDAERAIKIYKTFCKQTEQVVGYLSVARQFEHATRLEIPKLKHAPITLAASLQEYLEDRDFEINRRQYLAEQEAKQSGKPIVTRSSEPQSSTSSKMATPFDEKPASRPQATNQAGQTMKGPAPDLIDFFESIDQNQQTMQTNPFLQQQQQQTGAQMPVQAANFQGFPQQNMSTHSATTGAVNPYMQQQPSQPAHAQPLQTQFTGAGFGGYGPQPAQQSFAPGTSFVQEQQQQYLSPVSTQSPAPLQQQVTNPFRQSMMATGASGLTSFGQQPQQPQQQAPQRTGTNPFARSGMSSIPENAASPVPQQQPAYTPQPLQAQPTGTNPFARSAPSQPPNAPASPPNALQVQPTGSTNPFRQSMFVNQQTGTGWQHGPQGTMGGLENLETLPVFPRPGGQPTQQSPWG